MGARRSVGPDCAFRWYYIAKNELRDPIGVLRRRVRSDAGTRPSVSDALRAALHQQYTEHKSWSVQLHYDNLVVVAEEHKLARMPSYTTIRRYMQASGLTKVRPISRRKTEGTERAARRLEKREVRSYEATHVHGLWHADFHAGSRKVLLPAGRWVTAQLFGVLDDHSRLCCHLQWYLDETAETFVHGLSQALQKRALPRALMTDNGSGMIAAETTTGLEQLSIDHETTLTQSPYQNGKQESFWSQIENRLLPMLEGIEELTLDLLNESTQAWVELEYNHKVHDEIGAAPLRRYREAPNVGRDSPSSDTVRRAFRLRVWRHQRRSDGTVSIEGCRFELPSRFRQQRRVLVRYARWDLSCIDIVDPRSDKILSPLYPQDKAKNADGRRRVLEPLPAQPDVSPRRSGEMAPLLRKLMQQYAATGLPPAYLPKHGDNDVGLQADDTDEEKP
jgi:transposase InsO family protein